MTLIYWYKMIVILLMAVILTACPIIWPDRDYEFEYETIVTESPVNLEGINSRSDDYNSALPYPAGSYGIYFSCNGGAGQDFNIIHRDLDISYHLKDEVLDVHCGDPGNLTSYESMLLDLINTADDQLGPLFLFGPREYSYFFYSDNRDGNYDIRYTHHHKSFGTYGAGNLIYGPDTLLVINSGKDDLYPSFTEDLGRLFFCSNRENEQFDIYSIPLPDADGLHGFITGTEAVEPVLNAVLSSSFDDKCPFIDRDLMVFTSDREGGQGGFDLYYSFLENGEWTAPVNFGPGINTEYDEYRPIVFSFQDLYSHLMIFSSNRPGGLGGFDLYMVIADGIIQQQKRK